MFTWKRVFATLPRIKSVFQKEKEQGGQILFRQNHDGYGRQPVFPE